MIIVMKSSATDKEIQHVVSKVKEMGLKPHPSKGTERTVIGAVGDERLIKADQLKAIPSVESVMPILKPYKLVSRDFKKEDTVIKIKDVEIGNKNIVVMAGPCAVENEKQIAQTAKSIKKTGAQILRGGAFKPRTSPYAFQGLGEEGLKILSKAGKENSLLIVTEVMNVKDVELVSNYTDILQIGARNMQNFHLLRAVGKTKKAVLLKRGMSATLKEFLMSAEYILSEGNHNVMLCERGIRTFCTYTRNTLDLNIVPVLKSLTHLPVIVDPSHGTGKAGLVTPMSKASIAAGADGLIIEVHPDPENAVSDGDQSITPKQFFESMKELKVIAKAVNRTIGD
jgi:3-deoxy-7-phosphoheptulonate synthase